MADRYLRLTGTAPGRFVTRRLGLPQPAALRRWSPQTPDLPGPVLRLTAGETPEPGTYGGIVLDATAVNDPADLQDVHAALHPLARSLTNGAGPRVCARELVTVANAVGARLALRSRALVSRRQPWCRG